MIRREARKGAADRLPSLREFEWLSTATAHQDRPLRPDPMVACFPAAGKADGRPCADPSRRTSLL